VNGLAFGHWRIPSSERIPHFQRSKHLHFPDAGHIVMAEYPAEVNAAIATWIAEITS
jgi:pimeloyl-ACP methyl ester carboxylesterase